MSINFIIKQFLILFSIVYFFIYVNKRIDIFFYVYKYVVDICKKYNFYKKYDLIKEFQKEILNKNNEEKKEITDIYQKKLDKLSIEIDISQNFENCMGFKFKFIPSMLNCLYFLFSLQEKVSMSPDQYNHLDNMYLFVKEKQENEQKQKTS